MMRIAICEDDANTRAYLVSLIRAQSCPCQITEYAAAADCLAERGSFDLLFLDIELDPSGASQDGIALAKELRNAPQGAQSILIFVTGYDRYVFDAFDVGAFQYLLKPVDEGKFAQVFARAAEQLQASGKPPQTIRTLTLQAAGVHRIVPLDCIDYIESSNHKVILHQKEGTFAYYARIRELEAELQDQFFRIHKGYLVNLSCVSGYSKTEVTLASGEKLLISKYKYRDFVKAYLRFLKRGAGR